MDPMTSAPAPGPTDPRPTDPPSSTPGTSAAPVPGPTAGSGDTAVPGVQVADGRRLTVDGLRPVSPRLIPARYLGASIGYLIGLLLAAGAIVAAVLTGWWWIGLAAIVPLVIVAQSLLLTPRRVRAIGYLDGEQELTIARGIMFRTVSTIPYGRVQSVSIDEGPIERRYGLATLQITTGAAEQVPSLPGLPREEAERLRALLTARGIARMAAL